MNRILISGYYGFDNAGDEAVLAGLIKGLKANEAFGDSRISALSIAPEKTSKLHSIQSYHRYKQLARALIGSDLLLSGGGSLLQDVTSAHGIFYYLGVIRIAKILGRRTMMVAQGVGPLARSRSRKLTASVANSVDAITVRDQDSRALLRSIGVSKTVSVTADPALLLSKTATATDSSPLLSMRPWTGMSRVFLSDLSHAICHSSIPNQFSSLSMHGLQDHIAAANVITACNGTECDANSFDESADFRTLFNRASTAPILIGMRLHALIFAAAACVPIIALSYDPKVNAFMNELGQDDAVIDVATASLDRIVSVIDNVWSSRDRRSDELHQVLPRLKGLAQQNADTAIGLLH